MRRRIRKEALLPLLVAFFMVVGGFGSQVFVQDSETTERTAAISVIGESLTTAELGDETITQYEFATGGERFNSFDLSDKDELDELKSQGIIIPVERGTIDARSNTPKVMQSSEPGGPMAPGQECDINGPYGTEGDPNWEGDSDTLVITHTSDLVYFRYYIMVDGEMFYLNPQVDDNPLNYANWEYEPPSSMHTKEVTILDDYYGEICVECWDGISVIYQYSSGVVLEEPNPSWYIYYNGYMPVWTSGWQFEVLQSGVTVTDLGRYRDYYQRRVVDLLLYHEDGTYLGHAPGSGQSYGWQWGSFLEAFPGSATLTQGDRYRVGFAAEMRYQYSYLSGYHRATNGLPPGDEAIRPLSYAAGTGAGYPTDLPWNDRVGVIDIAWSRAFIVPDSEISCADAWWQNVPPDVYGVTVTPDPATEGEEVSLSAWFTDVGILDTFEYNIDWGDGTESGWTAIPLGSGMYALNNVLYWDDNFNHRAQEALDELSAEYGFTYVQVDQADITTWEQRLQERTWDLIVADNYWIIWIDPERHLGPLRDQVADGAQLVFFTWGYGYNSGWQNHEFWEETIGSDYQGEFFSPPPLYQWDPGHDIFNVLEPMPGSPNFPTANPAYRDGQYLEAEDISHAPAGWTPIEVDNRAGIIVRDDHHTVYNAFASDCYHTSDADFDGKNDMVELFKNEIMVVVTGSHGPTERFEMPYQLLATHTYLDDNPTGTPWDYYDIEVQVRDDDDSDARPAHPLLSDYTETITSPEEPFLDDGSGGFGTGTGLGDDAATYVPLPETFYFYGQEFNGMYICSNGFIDFDDSHVEYWLSGIPQGGAFDNTLYHMWTDMNPGYRGDVYYMTVEDPNNPGFDMFVVTVDNVPHYYYYGNYDIQIWLSFADYTIRFNYQQVNPVYSYTHTIGIEGPDTSWFVQTFVGTYPPGYRSILYEATLWAPALPPIPGIGIGYYTLKVMNSEPEVGESPIAPRQTEENQPLTVSGLQIFDAALEVDTEWFAYRAVGDWGETHPWTYLGSLAPPQMSVLLVHSFEADVGNMVGLLEDLEIVDQVDTWSIFERAPLCQAPPLDLMKEYDAIVFGTNWAWQDWYAPDFRVARRETGNRLADYLDQTLAAGDAGGVVTVMATYDDSPYYGDLFRLPDDSRYMYDEYGAFLPAIYPFGAATLGDVFPSEPFFNEIMHGQYGDVTSLSSAAIHSPEYDLSDPDTPTPGGTVSLLAEWGDGGSAIGVKQTGHGPRSCNIGIFGGYQFGGDFEELMGNCLLFASQEFIPTNVIPDMVVTIGDNGIYDLDIQVVDDDMGWVWDPVLGDLVPADLPPEYSGYEPQISHNHMEIEVLNLDPVIDRLHVYVEGDLCMRMSGNKGNQATLEVFDGTTLHTLTLVRDPGAPEFGCIEDLHMDLAMSSGSFVRVIYVPGDDDGSNPTWIVEGYWPGDDPHKIHMVFDSKKGIQVKYVSFGDLLLNVPINFEVHAHDEGSDDLAAIWDWGDGTPMGIQVHDNTVGGLCGGANEQLRTEFLVPSIFTGCSDDVFMRGWNTLRTPEVNPMAIFDEQTHAFTERYLYYTMVLVPDDDNNEGYPSPYLGDGYDMDHVLLNFK